MLAKILKKLEINIENKIDVKAESDYEIPAAKAATPPVSNKTENKNAPKSKEVPAKKPKALFPPKKN